MTSKKYETETLLSTLYQRRGDIAANLTEPSLRKKLVEYFEAAFASETVSDEFLEFCYTRIPQFADLERCRQEDQDEFKTIDPEIFRNELVDPPDHPMPETDGEKK
ncbi:MAG: hypothetical protein B6245_09665 [Desulfobacteraceae bacterium 4572_88]|nr:MAG: hypothetical protein B6245_09665 [Desulfobacteraceae bacterium 4572_88]